MHRWIALAAILFTASSALPAPADDRMDCYRQRIMSACEWLARKGNPEDQYSFGLYHVERRDYANAWKWFHSAAVQGYGIAQVALGGMYEEGKFVPQDYVQAYKWFSLSASGDQTFTIEDRNNVIKSRDLVESKMTPAQSVEAQTFVREWKPK